MGLFPKAMAWPRKGTLEGMNGGYFCKMTPEKGDECTLTLSINNHFSASYFISQLTYSILVTGLTEQHLRQVSQDESDERSCQDHGGQVLVHFPNGVPEKFTAHFIQIR